MIQPQYNPAYPPMYQPPMYQPPMYQQPMYQQPMYPAQPAAAPATGASAVSIQIFEPKAYSGTAVPMPQYDSQFYNYPQASIYNPYAPYQTAPMSPQYPYPMPQAPQYNPYQPIQQYPPMAAPQYPYPMPQAPQYNPYQPIQQYPPAPVPQIIEQQPMPQPVIETPQQPAEPVQPGATTDPTQPVAPTQPQQPVIENPAPQANIVDVARINQELSSPNLNQQTETITKVAQMSQAEPAIALQVVENGVMQNLANIIAMNTAELPGPTDEQIKVAQKLQKGGSLTPAEQQLMDQSSPKEVAEKNKVFAMFTLAMLQKLQRDEIDQFNAQSGGAAVVPPLKLQEVIGFNEIVNATTTTQIPAVKAAGIQAIAYAATPEDVETVKTILMPFLNDKEAIVQQSTKEALAKLGVQVQPQAQPLTKKEAKAAEKTAKAEAKAEAKAAKAEAKAAAKAAA